MKKLLFFFAVLLPLHLLAQNTYYVSNSGSDSNSGTSESSPWESLTKVNSQTFSAGDQILFKRGDQWEGTITVSASGSSGNPIVYGAYGNGDNPKINCSEQLTGWTLHSGNIYKTSLEKSISQLFLNGEKMQVARYPNSGYATIDEVNSSNTLTCNELNETFDYSGATWFGRTNGFATPTYIVTSSQGQTITLPSAPFGDLDENEGFILLNRLELLDSAGEWYYDSVSDTVYFWTPAGDSPSNYEIRVSTYDTGILVPSKNNITIQNFSILNGKVSGIYCSGNNITIRNNTILSPEAKGIFIHYGTGDTISGNSVQGAVHMGIEGFTTESLYEDNNVSNTFSFENIGITGCGEWYMGSGMYVQGDDNLIRYNHIENSGYNGIHFAKRNIVEYNYIKNVNLTKDDGGGIYTSTDQSYPNATNRNSIIRYNIIDGSYGTLEGWSHYNIPYGEGIYLDNVSGGITVEYNTITNCSSNGIFLHKGYEHTVQHNTIFRTKNGILIKQQGIGTKVKNNIIYGLGRDMGNSQSEAMIRQYLVSSQPVIDSNRYINHYKESDIFIITNSKYNFTDWQDSTSQDINSTIDVSPLEIGEEGILFYNTSKEVKTFDLGNLVYKNIDGEEITEELTLAPFTSQVLTMLKSTKGNTAIYNTVTTSPQRRAQPVIFDEPGEIESISIYHEGGTGNVLLGVYANLNNSPSDMLGVTPNTSVNNSSGWQTISLIDPISVFAGDTIWLSWVFENNPGIRYLTSNTIRAESADTWSSGMPDIFGTATYANYQYSIYCNYVPKPIETVGNDEVYTQITNSPYRRAIPVTFSNSGEIINISIYHEGGTGNVLLGVYSNQNGNISNLLGVTNSTAINDSSGWQTISLIEPVIVNYSDTVWLAWVFENNPGIRYSYGGSSRAQSYQTWNSGMPHAFGSATFANYQYSIYCNYIKSLTKSATISPSYEPTTIAANNLAQYSTEKITINEGEAYLSWTEPGTYQRVLTASSGADSIVTTILIVAPPTLVSEIDKHDTPNLEVDEKSSVIAEYFKVYPNPANTYVNIECEAVPDIQSKLIIMNSSGETLLNTLVESTLTRMDISHLPAGIYFIRMVNGKNDMSKKMIVTNKKR